MLGGIVGDIIGSVYEWDRIKTKEFPLFCKESKFTDDSILTCATAKVLLDGGSYAEAYADFAIRYPGGGYGGRFSEWMRAWEREPYNSLGNGSAMRVGPVGWVSREGHTLLWDARRSAQCTHNHPEGIRGAQAIAMAIHLARLGNSQEIIREEMTDFFGYDLSRSLDEIRPDYQFDETCPGTVPEAIQCFLESTDFEDCIRNAVSLGGDSDTLACIAGSIAEPFYGGVPDDIATPALALLPQEFVEIIVRFKDKFVLPNHPHTHKEFVKNMGDMHKREADAAMSGDPCEVWQSGEVIGDQYSVAEKTIDFRQDNRMVRIIEPDEEEAFDPSSLTPEELVQALRNGAILCRELAKRLPEIYGFENMPLTWLTEDTENE